MRLTEHVRAAVAHHYERARRYRAQQGRFAYDLARARESEIESWTQHHMEGRGDDDSELLDAAAHAHAHYREWPSSHSLDRAIIA